jgi:nucleotide-binding universal stress UspA family protein
VWAPDRALRGERIVCAVRDDRDAPAVKLAATLAELLGLGLTLAQVLPPGLAGTAVPGPVVLQPQGPAMTPERLALRQLLQLLDAALADHPALRDRCEVRLRRGQPAPQLDALCDEEQAALIVLGPQRRGALRIALLGSVARDLARHGTRPIVGCPQPPSRSRGAAPLQRARGVA